MNDSIIVRGIDNLNYNTPRALRKLWQRYKQEIPIPDGITTTVYHFGFSEDTQLIHSYAYRSANDFTPERLERYGLRFKPECQVPADYHLPDDFITIMDEQRAIQASKPKEDRLYIGGEIEVNWSTICLGMGFGYIRSIGLPTMIGTKPPSSMTCTSPSFSGSREAFGTQTKR
jgi:hypothetical protein